MEARPADLRARTCSRDLKTARRHGPGRRGGGGGGRRQRSGSIETGLKAADVRLEQTYTIAYIAHAPLEPRAAVAEWEDGKLTVWTGTQRPFGVRGELAAAFGLPDDAVRVIVPDTGAGYGGKHTGEAAVEAARLARAAGRPVKLVWTREEEFTWAYFRPAGVIDVGSGVTQGRHAHRLGVPQLQLRRLGHPARPTRCPIRSPRSTSRIRRCGRARTGRWRPRPTTSPASRTWTNWPMPSDIDPLEFRLKNLKDDAAARRARGRGRSRSAGARKPAPIAASASRSGIEKGSYVATCAEVAVDRSSGRVQVVRAVSAFECGAVVNPDHLKNQVEGAMIMGLGGALFEAIEFDGRQDPQPAVLEVPRAAVPRRARDRGRPARPQGPAVGRRRRDADRRHRPGGRQRHLRRHRRAAALDAHGAQWAEDLRDRPVRLREPRKTRKARNETARPSARAGPILGDSFRAFRVPFNRFERGPAGTRSEMTEYGKEPGFTNAGGTSWRDHGYHPQGSSHHDGARRPAR